MVKTSVLLTVFNREPEVLLAVLRNLRRCWPDDAELIVVDDGSTMDYQFAKTYIEHSFDEAEWVKLEDYEACRIDGFNNPAHAFNVAVECANADRLIVMSSDTLIWKSAMAGALAHDTGSGPFTPAVIDLESNLQYCGPSRVFPMPWMLTCSKAMLLDVGGWDENYLQGHCYEDNDVLGRLVLEAGQFGVDWDAIVHHISHDTPHYDKTSETHMRANGVNRAYTLRKWGGIPFDPTLPPFNIKRKLRTSGKTFYECTGKPGLLSHVKAFSKPTGAPLTVEGWIAEHTRGAKCVVDLGAGDFHKLEFVENGAKKVGIELFKPYVQKAPDTVIGIHGDFRNWQFLLPSQDWWHVAMLIDSLEHVPAEDGMLLLRSLQGSFSKILVFTPNGLHPQDEDVTGLGNPYQKHECGWEPYELRDMGFTVTVDPAFHGEKGGAIFAVWEK